MAFYNCPQLEHRGLVLKAPYPSLLTSHLMWTALRHNLGLGGSQILGKKLSYELLAAYTP